MKKFILGIVGVMMAAVSAFGIANTINGTETRTSGHETTVLEDSSNGACTHKGCKCKKFDQRPGHYACWCGHQRYMHQ